MTFENPAHIDGRDFFDDIKIQLKDKSLHWFQIKWGFQQSIGNSQKNLSLSSFINPGHKNKGNLFLGDLYNAWNNYNVSKNKIVCHIYTSKSYSVDLRPFLKSAKSALSDNGQIKKFKKTIFKKLPSELKHKIKADNFNQFLDYLFLSFSQPSMFLEPNISGPLGDLIFQRISALG